MEQQAVLRELVPQGWKFKILPGAVMLLAPTQQLAECTARGAKRFYVDRAKKAGFQIQIGWKGSIIESFGDTSSPIDPDQAAVSSYGAERIAPNASYEAINDFIAGKQVEGRIVTVMSMGSDRFLFVNGAQVSDRGGDAETWIGVDAKALVWGRSLMGTLPGRDRGVNYYARLHELLERDRFIPDYSYCVTRPNGDLHRDVSTYFYLENYLGVPARVAVSQVGNSELVEMAK